MKDIILLSTLIAFLQLDILSNQETASLSIPFDKIIIIIDIDAQEVLHQLRHVRRPAHSQDEG